MAQTTSDSSIANQLTGTYRDGTDGVLRIEQVGGRLLLRVGDQDPIRLMSSSNSIFSAQIPQIKIRLAPTLPIIILTEGDRTFEVIKVPEEPRG